MSGAIKRFPGEKFADFAARQKAAQQIERTRAGVRKQKRRKKNGEGPSPPSLDPDGLYRDNLGESPDY